VNNGFEKFKIKNHTNYVVTITFVRFSNNGFEKFKIKNHTNYGVKITFVRFSILYSLT